MIKLLNRRQRNRTATIVSGWDAESGTFITHTMWLADAEMLHDGGSTGFKLQKLDVGKALKGPCYGPLRSFRQQLHNEWPPLHRDVLTLIAKYENATHNKGEQNNVTDEEA